MPSTDRLLWLLQVALFVAAVIYVFFAVLAAVAVWTLDAQQFPPGCGRWIATDPFGPVMTLEPENCEPSGLFSVLANLFFMLAEALPLAALGAIIFCLRRIGNVMGRD